LILKDGANALSENIGNQQQMIPCNIPEEERSKMFIDQDQLFCVIYLQQAPQVTSDV
jgi:hypothetical protein